MSQEYVEIIRAVVDALNRRDIDAALKHAAPDFEFDFSRAVGPQHGVFRRDDVPGFFRELTETWESVRWAEEEFIEAGEQVVTPFTSVHRGRDGIELQARGAWMWTFRDGKFARIIFYQELHEALKAAGLSDSQK